MKKSSKSLTLGRTHASKGTFGRYECVYNNGSNRDVERLLRTSRKLDDVMRPLWKFEGTFEEANEVADEVIESQTAW